MTSTTYDATDYQRPSVTVDTILFSIRNGTPHVLLIRRGRWPFEGYWAIPGGFVEIDESLEDAAARELFEETGLADVPLQQLHAFGDPGRDPRTRVITVSYVAQVTDEQARGIRAGDDAADARWWPVSDLPPLAFDHARILEVALQRRSDLDHP
ncbi:MAG: NUDIX hydrolase [Caldilineales bacterium]